MASVVVGGTRKKSLTLNGVDPETCMIVFKNHWAQVIDRTHSVFSLPVTQHTNQRRFSPLCLCRFRLSYFPYNDWQTTRVCACVCALVCVCLLLTQTLALKHRIHLAQTSLSMPAKKPKHTL